MRSFDLQWLAHRTYWRNAAAGHRAAIMAVIDDLRHGTPHASTRP